MPARIAEYTIACGSRRRAAVADGRTADDADALREVLTLLRVRTGHDFSNYKPGTLLRRIAAPHERRRPVRR